MDANNLRKLATDLSNLSQYLLQTANDLEITYARIEQLEIENQKNNELRKKLAELLTEGI